MQLIDTSTAIASRPTPLALGTPGWFAQPNPGGGVPATVTSADWANGIQGEIVSVIEAANMTPDKTSVTQLLASMQYLFGGNGSRGASGWMKMPGGIILQWGVGISTSGPETVVFPTAYGTNPTAVVVCEEHASGWGNPPAPTLYGVDSPNQYGFLVYATRIQTTGVPAYQPGLTFNWMSIGY